MEKFIHGIELCESFFAEIAKPLLDEHFPCLVYSAGLIGYGSDVLGYDDAVSTDHMWGPRFYLFLGEGDMALKESIENMFSDSLPYTYKGYSVNFSEPDPNDNGVRHAKFISEGKVSSLIYINTFESFVKNYLGKSDFDNLSYLDWLSFSEHKLLALTSGKMFFDDLKIDEQRKKIKFYPDNVKLYMIASNWSIIAEEQAFIRRCGDVGDDIGSRIITARIVDRLMRLCFLYENKYAPYSKWFGTAFSRLNIDVRIKNSISVALSANDLQKREKYIVEAQRLVAELHNKCGITEYVKAEATDYFGRDIKVIFTEQLTDAVMKKLKNTAFEKMPLISTFSQIGNFSYISDDFKYSEKIKKIYI